MADLRGRARCRRGWGPAGRRAPLTSSEEVRCVDAARPQERAQLAEPGALDLPDALASQAETLADRLELLGRIALEAEAPTQHGALVGGEVVEHRDQVGS